MSTCVLYVYMWECTHSHSLNSTWHKQQSLCKKRHYFCKAKHSRVISRLVALNIPILTPGKQGPSRETRREGEDTVCADSLVCSRPFLLSTPFILLEYIFFFLLFYFCRFLVLSATDLSVGSKRINLVLWDTVTLTLIFNQDHLCLSSPFSSNILLHLVLVLISQINK